MPSRGPSTFEDPEAHRRSAAGQGDLRDGDPAAWFDSSNAGQWWATDSRAAFVIAYRMFGVVRSSWSDAPIWLRILWAPVWAVIATAVALSIEGSAVVAVLVGLAVGCVGYLATLKLIRIAYPPDRPDA